MHAKRVFINPMVQSHVPANVRAEVARQGKKQEDLAALLGITRQAVSRRLLGHVVFDVDELQAVANFLGVPVASLLEGAQVPA